MTDAITLLSQDHRAVEKLFSKYQSFPSPQTAQQICRELTVHAAIEESVLYPVLAQKIEEGADLNKEAVEEHMEMKVLIGKIQEAQFKNDGSQQLIKELQQDVEHHVKDEETEMFPKMKKALGQEMMVELGEKLATLKRAELSVGGGTAQNALAQAGSSSDQYVDLTRDELYELAQKKDLAGRSDMTKDQLISALQRNS